MKLHLTLLLAAGAVLSALTSATTSTPEPVQAFGPAELSEQTMECIDCHRKESRSIYEQWGDSKHYRANVGCYECHKADRKDADAFEHYEHYISIIVSPKDCANCHSKEVKEFDESHHAQGGKIIGSLDNLLADVVEGNNGMVTEAFPHGVSAATVNGCWQCHGSEVKVNADGSLDPATWPNTGIGRFNPDGSKGSCAACHQRHEFSAEQARHPDTCGKCHLGPDHPQKEIYEESKHGIAFFSHLDDMNMDSPKWIVGEDYSAAPTCATCHMSATKKQPVTHDIGMRISWNNRPVLSVRPEVSDAKMGLPGADVNWRTRRENMKDVCSSCHAEGWIDNWYIQYDALIELYNEKYGKAGAKLMEAAGPLLNPVKFSNKLDFIWFELWHHEGRRARHAAAMQGPDYTHWHGTYELARNFYTHMLPELEELYEEGIHSEDAERVAAAENLRKVIDEVLNDDNHKWFLGIVDPEDKARRDAARKEFQERYK